jgi:hypothetical protein
MEPRMNRYRLSEGPFRTGSRKLNSGISNIEL